MTYPKAALHRLVESCYNGRILLAERSGRVEGTFAMPQRWGEEEASSQVHYLSSQLSEEHAPLLDIQHIRVVGTCVPVDESSSAPSALLLLSSGNDFTLTGTWTSVDGSRSGGFWLRGNVSESFSGVYWIGDWADDTTQQQYPWSWTSDVHDDAMSLVVYKFVAGSQMAKYNMAIAWALVIETAIQLAGALLKTARGAVMSSAFNFFYALIYLAYLIMYAETPAKRRPRGQYIFGIVLYEIGYLCFAALPLLTTAETQLPAYTMGSVLFVLGSLLLIAPCLPRDAVTGRVQCVSPLRFEMSSLNGCVFFTLGSVAFTADALRATSAAPNAMLSRFLTTSGLLLFLLGRFAFLRASQSPRCGLFFQGAFKSAHAARPRPSVGTSMVPGARASTEGFARRRTRPPHIFPGHAGRPGSLIVPSGLRLRRPKPGITISPEFVAMQHMNRRTITPRMQDLELPSRATPSIRPPTPPAAMKERERVDGAVGRPEQAQGTRGGGGGGGDGEGGGSSDECVVVMSQDRDGDQDSTRWEAGSARDTGASATSSASKASPSPSAAADDADADAVASASPRVLRVPPSRWRHLETAAAREYRQNYRSFRLGKAEGAKGQRPANAEDANAKIRASVPVFFEA